VSKVVGDVAIKVGADTAALTTGMRGAEMSLAKFGKVAGAALAATAIAMVALTAKSMANIDVLAKQARSLGLTTQAFQKMAMVAGEAGVEAGNLSNMLGKMQRNIDELRQGTVTQTEAFGRLGVSIADLQGLSPDDQFAKIASSLDAIKDPAEKTALAMEVFGKSGRDAINMLSDYGSKAAEAAEFQNRFGIAVSQASAEGVERANDAVGRLGMVMQGLGNTMAGAVAPGIEATANALIAFAGSVTGAKVTLDEFFGTLEAAKTALGEDVFNKLLGRPDLIREFAPELAAITSEIDALATVAATASPQFRIFADELAALDETKASEEMRALADETDKAKQELAAGTIEAEEFQAKMSEIITRANEITTAFEGINGSDFSAAYSNIEGLAARLWNAAAAAKAAMNALPGAEGALEMAGSDGSSLSVPFTADPSAPRTRPQQVGIDSVGNFNAANAPRGGGGGGGGGIKDHFAQRLEALQEGLATEADAVAEWYLEGQTTLEDALANKALTESEYHTLRERLEEEHQRRLAGIREIGNQSALSMALGAGEQILNAIGQTNAKALKVAKVFGAAQALISAYQGAAEALKLPFPANIAAAATVLAKGIGFVNAIRSVNSGGGGGGATGGGGGGSSAQSQAPAQTPLDVRLTGFGPNDLFTGDMIGGLLDRLSTEAGDRGYRIMTA